MGEIRSYRDLLIWRQAMNLAADIYRLTRSWPKEELYGLTSQARRAATSVPANIAEGYGRPNRGPERRVISALLRWQSDFRAVLLKLPAEAGHPGHEDDLERYESEDGAAAEDHP